MKFNLTLLFTLAGIGTTLATPIGHDGNLIARGDNVNHGEFAILGQRCGPQGECPEHYQCQTNVNWCRCKPFHLQFCKNN